MWLVNGLSLDGVVLRMFLLVVGFFVCIVVFQLVLAFFSLQWWVSSAPSGLILCCSLRFC